MSKQHYKTETFRARYCIGYLVKHAHGLMLDRIEAEFDAHGFSFIQWVVLRHLQDGIANTAGDIAREARHDSGALTRVIDQLEKRGLIRRSRSSDDRRVVELEITETGKSMLMETTAVIVDSLNWSLEGFSRKEVAQFTDYLIRLIGRLREPRETDSPALAALIGIDR